MQDNCLDAGSKACKSFLVNRQTLRCRLFSDTIENMGFKPNTATSNPQFYSVRAPFLIKVASGAQALTS